MIQTLTSLLLLSCLAACASSPENIDPLKNSKRLFREGHGNLYMNGAFQVPSTHLYLIPPGPQPLTVVTDSMMPKAKASFRKALDAVSDTVMIVADGSKATYRVAGDISEAGTKARTEIQAMMRPQSKLIILKSSEAGKNLIGEAWVNGKSAGAKLEGAAVSANKVRQGVEDSRAETKKNISKNAESLAAQSVQTSKNTNEEYDQDVKDRSSKWILGQAMRDKNIAQNESDFESKKSFERFTKSFQDTEQDRQGTSNRMRYMINGSFSEGQKSADDSYKNAMTEWNEGSKENGPTISAIRAMGWLLKGTLWDYGIVPVSTSAVGGLGYVLYNGLAYPVILGTKQGYNSALLAVEYTSLKLGNGYEYIAPSTSAAFAGIIISAKYAGGHVKAGALKAGSAGVEYGGVAIAETVALTAETGLYAGEKSVHYVGVPLSILGTTAGSAVSGAVIATAGVVGGATLAATGEVTAWGSEVSSKAVAGAALVTGAAGSAVAGASVGVFEVAQGIFVPSSIFLGSAVVVTYGGLTQLAAQSVLMASDAAYLVISLEGPKYVVYAVKGLVNPKQDLPQGTVVDLDELRKKGEEIKKLPLSDEEINRLVNSMTKDLPIKP